MNYIWCFMIIVSIVVSIFNGTVDQTINGAFEGAKSAVFTVLSFAASGSAGIGRQARLRGVCHTTYEFKSRLPHQDGATFGRSFFYSLLLDSRM